MKRIFLFVIILLSVSFCFAYNVGDTFQMGYDSDGSPLTWQILEVDGSRAFVISKYVLKEERAYNETLSNVTWENCSLRRWLNSTFFDSYFSDNEKSKIVEVKVKNNEDFWYWRLGRNTEDKVFLLSRREVVDYFGTEEERIACFPDGDTCEWWLRTPGFYWCYACSVRYDGKLVQFVNANEVNENDLVGVRPVMWVEL